MNLAARMGALCAALAVTAILVAAAIFAVQWLLDVTMAMHFHLSKSATVFLPSFTSMMICYWAVFIALRQRRAKKAEDDEPLKPLVRRSPLTGLREI
ncbi:MAG TPA: hypothetical protein VGB91_03605 [Rhizomicrobium sp.]